jgi:serine/threonine protein kinase
MTQALTVILKPGYAPVEQYADSPDFKQGPWTDIYALGAVIYGAVAKKPPPPSVTRLLSDSYKRLVDDTELRSRFSERFLGAIDSALAVRPEDRPQSMAEFRSLLGVSTKSSVKSSNGLTRIASLNNVEAATKKRYVPMVAVGMGAALLVLAGYGILKKPSTPVGAQASSSTIPAVQTPVAAIVAATPSLTPIALIESIQKAANNDIKVTAVAKSATVKIANKEKLEFSIQSASAGYAFVYLLSSGGELLQLFPNQLDKRNRIKAGETLKLPRASWPMEAGGPVGVNRFVAIVSNNEREFSSSGLINDGVFSRYAVDSLLALEKSKPEGAQPLMVGKPSCAGANPCDTNFGAALFTISEE